MRRAIAYLILMLTFLTSCEKEERMMEIADITNRVFLEIIDGNNQIGSYNSPLSDSLVVKVSSSDGNPISDATVSFELEAGGGSVSRDWVLTDTSGRASVAWATGCRGENLLSAYLTDSVSNILDSVRFRATASLTKGWSKSCGVGYTHAYEVDFTEHNGTLYLSNFDKIYITDDEGISWHEFENMPPLTPFSDIFDIQFNDQGWMYIATRNDGVFYSEDQINWHQINSGILDKRDPVGFLVEDSCLFASFYFDGLYRSIDNGKSWKKLLIDGNYRDRYVHINRHPNGDLYLFDKWDSFWHSVDNGDNWERVSIDRKYTNFEIEDFLIDTEGNLYLGAGDATISILSAETYEGISYTYYEYNASSQSAGEIQIIDNTVYYTIFGHPDPDIYSSQGWDKLDLGFEERIYAFHLKSDGTFLIAAFDGIYYYNE